MTHSELSAQVARGLLRIGAIRIQPERPFKWASGWNSPVYTDNRLILAHPEFRELVCRSFIELIESENLEPEVIAGVATGAIAHGMLVADRLKLPYAYIRPEPKKHGLGNQVEGAPVDGKRVVVLEDLVSTGKSSLAAVSAVQKSGGSVLALMSIFNYGFEESKKLFAAENLPVHYLCNLEAVLQQARLAGELTKAQLELVQQFRQNPATYGTA
jgi:orotate phosphoribosyltransferase